MNVIKILKSNIKHYFSVPRYIYTLSFVLSTIPTLILIASYFTTRNYQHFNWEFQPDMFFYLAHVKEMINSHNFFAYSLAYEPSLNNPPVYSFLFFVLTAIISYILQIEPIVLFIIFRYVFGIFFTITLWYFYTNYINFKNSFHQLFFFTLLCTAGGIFTIIFSITSAISNGKINEIIFAAGYIPLWWHLNIYQTFFTVTELFYQSLSYGTVLAYIKNKHSLALFLFILTLYSHPFHGGYIFLVLLTYSTFQIIKSKKRFNVQKSILFGIGLTAFTVFAYYHLIFLTNQPLHRILITNYVNTQYIIPLLSQLLYWGLWIISIVYFSKTIMKKRIFHENNWLIILIGLALNWVLVNHNLFLQISVQPAHFSRSYIYFFLGLITIKIISEQKNIINQINTALTTKKIIILSSIIAVLMSDNIYFSVDAFLRTLHAPQTITNFQYDILKQLNNFPDSKLVASFDYQIYYLTPYYSKLKTIPPIKDIDMSKSATFLPALTTTTYGDFEINKNKLIVISNDNNTILKQLIDHYNFVIAYQNQKYVILETK